MRISRKGLNCVTMFNKYKTSYPAYPLSDEQRAIFEAIGRGESVASDSCAGSGKTHTADACVVAWDGEVHLIPHARSLMTAQAEKFAGFANVHVVNAHSRGKRLLGKVTVDDKKLEDIAKRIIEDNIPLSKKLAGLAKYAKIESVGVWENALSITEVAAKYNFALTEKEQSYIEKHHDGASMEELVKEILKLSDSDLRIIDYEDMLRLPVISGNINPLPKSALVVLDEVQDYSPLMLSFLLKLTAPGTTVLMIGDPSRQSLQQFSGASPQLFDIMADYFNCVRLRLTVNRRCAKAIVAAAPHKGDMKALDDAETGIVETLPAQTVINDIMAGEYQSFALLSETNAPLVQLGTKLILEGIPVRIRMGKIDKLIMRYAYKHIVNRKLQVGDIFPLMLEEIGEMAGEGIDVGEFSDIAKVIGALEEYCLSKGILKTTWVNRRPCHPIQQALSIITQGNEGITLMTGHVSKGLEFHTVFYLPSKMRAPETDWQKHQNDCLAHVIATRAKHRFVTLAVED